MAGRFAPRVTAISVNVGGRTSHRIGSTQRASPNPWIKSEGIPCRGICEPHAARGGADRLGTSSLQPIRTKPRGLHSTQWARGSDDVAGAHILITPRPV